VIATHGQVEPLGIGIPSAFDFADATPIDLGGISVLLVASDDTTFTADTLRHVEVKAVLLAGGQLPLRNVESRFGGDGAVCGS